MSTPGIGRGTPVASWPRTTGTVRVFREPGDVIAALDTDLERTIAFVESGGTTFLGPILGQLGGIICRTGTLRSHLAIVSREYELPCIVGVELTEDLETGDEIVLDDEGTVARA